jgi:hypothetical protein
MRQRFGERTMDSRLRGNDVGFNEHLGYYKTPGLD